MTAVQEVVATPAAEPTRASGPRSELLAAIERLTGFTALGQITLVIGIAFAALGRSVPSRGLALLGYGFLLVLAASWFLGRRSLPLEVERAELPSRVPARRTVEAGLTLTSGRRVGALVLEEVLDPALGPNVRFGVPGLSAGQPVTNGYTFEPQVRGIFEVGPTIAESTDPFGLTRRRQTLLAAETVIVHPRVESVADRITRREWEDPPQRPPFSRPWPSGSEFYGMREYQDGDDPRRIVWRAFAQYGKYMVRESEQGVTDRVVILMDTETASHSAGTPSATFETAVSVAASVAAGHLKDGFAVTLDTCEDRQVKNLRGSNKRIPLLDVMAGIEQEKATAVQMLDRLFVDAQSNAHCVFITPRLTQAAASRLRVLLQRGTSIEVVIVVTPETDPLTLHRAAGLSCPVMEVAPGEPIAPAFRRVMGGVGR